MITTNHDVNADQATADINQYPSLPSAPYDVAYGTNGQYVVQPQGVQYAVDQPVVVQQIHQPQIICIAVPPQNAVVQPPKVAEHQRTVIVEEKPVKRSFPLWIELALFVCTLLMMCGVGWYLNKFEDIYGNSLRKHSKQIKDEDEYWTIVGKLLLGKYTTGNKDEDIAMGPGIGLMIPSMIISLIVGVIGVVSFKIRKNARMIYFMTFLVISFMHFMLYLIGHRWTKPEDFKTRKEYRYRINTIWFTYLISVLLIAIVQTITFIRSDGFSKSALGGRVGVWIVKFIGVAIFYPYTVCIISVVYAIDPRTGINNVFAAVGLMSALWIAYTAITFIRNTRTMNDDIIPKKNFKEVKVAQINVVHV